MKVSARFDYAIRAMIEVAAASNEGRRITADEIANRQGISWRFLQAVLATLLQAGLLTSARGSHGGYQLAVGASEITIGTIGRAMGGPLVTINGTPPERLDRAGRAVSTQALWISLGAAVDTMLDEISIADLLARGGA